MKLTPLDIRHKEFKRGLRGYVDGDVDEFLDEVADEFERLFKENIELGEQVDSLQERVDQYRNLEETLQKTLVSAQKSAEELKVNAEKEAQLILREAEMKARQMVNDSYADKQAVEKAIVMIKGTEDEFRFKFRALLQGYMKQVDELEERAREAVEESSHAGEPAPEEKRALAAQETVAAPAIPEQAAPSSRPAEPDRSPTSGGVFGIGASRRDPGQTGTAEPAGSTSAPSSPGEASPGAGEPPPGIGDDLLADVETEVNDDEFKW
jgi:cell division initiation protein